MTTSVTLDLDDELVGALKAIADRYGWTLEETIIDALREHVTRRLALVRPADLDESQRAAVAAFFRTLPRTYRAGGSADTARPAPLSDLIQDATDPADPETDRAKE